MKWEEFNSRINSVIWTETQFTVFKYFLFIF